MLGLMQNQPLLISSLLEHAARHHADTEVVSRTIEGSIHRYTYADLARRTRKLANVLAGLGVQTGDRVATLAWNGFRHLELYYGISSTGAVLHTLNPRLFQDQLVWIANHAEDSYLFFDLTFVPLVETLAPQLKSVKKFVLMTDRAHMPADSKIPGLQCYEDLMAAAGEDYEWPQFDENTASSLCYTSGTTGNPKGVLYSHRSNVLEAYGASLPDTLNLSAFDSVMPVVPMFHANSWCLVYACLLTGAKLVLPGKDMDGKSLYELMQAEQVTFAAGVPTIWLLLLQYIEKEGLRFTTLKRTVIGGSACPPAMMRTFQDKYGVTVLHAWGMTEMSPLGSVSTLKYKHKTWTPEKQNELLYKQGRTIYGVDMKIVDDAGKSLPWDGKAFGNLLVKGYWVLRDYYKSEPGSTLQGGWFPTGDVATIDADGYMQITDRTKDVIKSGGEWISSIDLENLAIAHPAVAEAACIAAQHPKWAERPLLVVVKKPNMELTREEMLKFFEGKIAKWWMPDDVIFVDELPHTATGKLQKLKLREKFKDYKLPTA
ncbi:MAG TPA: 3-(methylthio)propionyl-CoA ligase [Burkholderiales bacterium]|nr:3-(methylthio)propionyl-CoA ligase [Burkholderiales bacterium]